MPNWQKPCDMGGNTIKITYICDETCQNQALLPKMGFKVIVLFNKRVPLAFI